MPGKPLVLHGLYRLLLQHNLQPREFDPALLEQQTAARALAPAPEVDLAALMAENEALRAELTPAGRPSSPVTPPKPLDLSEYKTRKLYIDAMLTDAGWTEGKDWLNEVELPGMPNKSEVGYADYVLYDDAHRPWPSSRPSAPVWTRPRAASRHRSTPKF